MSYTNQANIEANIGRSLTSGEVTILTLILTTIDEWIDNYLDEVGWNDDAEETRYYDGDTEILDIDPCNTITAIASVDSGETVLNNYDLDLDLESCPRNETVKTYVEKRGGNFPSGLRNIAVTALFSRVWPVPDDIVWLATYMISGYFKAGQKDGLKAESIEGYSRTFGDYITKTKEEDPNVLMVLDKYSKDQILI